MKREYTTAPGIMKNTFCGATSDTNLLQIAIADIITVVPTIKRVMSVVKIIGIIKHILA